MPGFRKEALIKIRTEEERRRIQEEGDAAPYVPGFTWGEFRRLPERRRSYEKQKTYQSVISSLGYFKTCPLGSCRRAKACKGLLSKTQYKSGLYHKSFPPCVGEGSPRQGELMKHARRLAGIVDEYNPVR